MGLFGFWFGFVFCCCFVCVLVCFVFKHKIKGTSVWDGGRTSPQLGHAMGRFFWGLSDTAQKQSSQHPST